MCSDRAHNLVKHVPHTSLLVPLKAAVPTFAGLKTFAIWIARVFAVPGLLSVLAEAERVLAAGVECVKLDPKNIQEQFVQLIPGEEFVHHAEHLLPQRSIQARNHT